MTHWPFLSLLIWVSILGAVPVLLAGDRRPRLARWLALLVALLTLVINLAMLPGFNDTTAAMQFTESHMWIRALNVHYALGVDGIAMALILLTTITTVLVIIGAWEVIKTRVHQYMAAMLVLQGFMIGVFAATDALLFYVFFEAQLIPMFILIGVWGGPRRVYASLNSFCTRFSARFSC